MDPLVAASPEAFTADMLIYSRRGTGGVTTRTATLPDEPPFVYIVLDECIQQRSAESS